MKTKRFLWLLVLIIGTASCSKKPKIKSEVSIHYTYTKKFGEYVEEYPKYKYIYEYNIQGLIDSYTYLTFERDSWEVYSKQVYKNDSLYIYDKYGDLDTVFYFERRAIKPKKLKNNVLLYYDKKDSDSVKQYNFLNPENILYKDSTIYKNGDYYIHNYNVLEVDKNKMLLKYIYSSTPYFKIVYEEPLDSLSFIKQRYSWSEKTYDEYLEDNKENNSKVGEYKSYKGDKYLVKNSYEYW